MTNEADEHVWTVDEILGSYYHLVNGAERALDCKNPNCHPDSEKELVRKYYTESLAQLCHDLVEAIEKRSF